MTVDELRINLATQEKLLKQHMASWGYAWSRGDRHFGADKHPLITAVNRTTDELTEKIKDLKCQISELTL